MIILLLIILVIYTIYTMQYLPPQHSNKVARIIGIIVFPFIGALLGLLCDLFIASNATTWIPVLCILGGGVGFIGSIIICAITLVQSNNYKQNLNSEKHILIFSIDGTEKQVTVSSQKNNPTFIEGWKNFIHNAFNFKGQTDLKMFGWGVLSYLIIKSICWLILTFITAIITVIFNDGRAEYIIVEIINYIIMIAISIPIIALNVRRFRDIGMKNWLNYTLNLIFLVLIPIPTINFIYGIILLIFLCKPTRNL